MLLVAWCDGLTLPFHAAGSAAPGSLGQGHHLCTTQQGPEPCSPHAGGSHLCRESTRLGGGEQVCMAVTRVRRHVRRDGTDMAARSAPYLGVGRGWGHGRPDCSQHPIFFLSGTLTSMMTLRFTVGAEETAAVGSLPSAGHCSLAWAGSSSPHAGTGASPAAPLPFPHLPSPPSLSLIPLPLPGTSLPLSQFPTGPHIPPFSIIWTSPPPLPSQLAPSTCCQPQGPFNVLDPPNNSGCPFLSSCSLPACKLHPLASRWL